VKTSNLIALFRERAPVAVPLGAGVALLAGCRGPHSALDPAGPQARQISELAWMFFGGAAAILLAVVVVHLWTLRRRARQSNIGSAPGGVALLEVERERRIARNVSWAVAATVLVLLGLLFTDYAVAHSLSAEPADPLVIKVTAHQWWWQFEYQDPVPANVFQTSNELHIPVGKPVRFLLQSADVIHSFWLPNFNGKKDLIPGHPTSTWFQADRAGTYYGQCAEFCGYQHAHMRIVLVAEAPEKFAAWQEAQRQPAAEPATDQQRRGQQVFVSTTCAMCHAIGGTPARSNVGPTLTHFGSQQMLAAGAFPNDRAHLESWLIDPQAMKPGVRMPAPPLTPGDRAALVEYLLSLK
jgi:cytochrome c oxidase subunit II